MNITEADLASLGPHQFLFYCMLAVEIWQISTFYFFGIFQTRFVVNASTAMVGCFWKASPEKENLCPYMFRAKHQIYCLKT